jgi:hypothetical protein
VYCALRAIAAMAASWVAALGPDDDARRDAGGVAAREWLVQPVLSAKTVTKTGVKTTALPRQSDPPRGRAASPRLKSTRPG